MTQPICYLCEHFTATEWVRPINGEPMVMCGVCFEAFPDEYVLDTYSL